MIHRNRFLSTRHHFRHLLFTWHLDRVSIGIVTASIATCSPKYNTEIFISMPNSTEWSTSWLKDKRFSFRRASFSIKVFHLRQGILQNVLFQQKVNGYSCFVEKSSRHRNYFCLSTLIICTDSVCNICFFDWIEKLVQCAVKDQERKTITYNFSRVQSLKIRVNTFTMTAIDVWLLGLSLDLLQSVDEKIGTREDIDKFFWIRRKVAKIGSRNDNIG